MVTTPRRPGPDDLRAWADFRAALAELGRIDPERARLYLGSAAGGLRAWLQAVRRLKAQQEEHDDER